MWLSTMPTRCCFSSQDLRPGMEEHPGRRRTPVPVVMRGAEALTPSSCAKEWRRAGGIFIAFLLLCFSCRVLHTPSLTSVHKGDLVLITPTHNPYMHTYSLTHLHSTYIPFSRPCYLAIHPVFVTVIDNGLIAIHEEGSCVLYSKPQHSSKVCRVLSHKIIDSRYRW